MLVRSLIEEGKVGSIDMSDGSCVYEIDREAVWGLKEPRNSAVNESTVNVVLKLIKYFQANNRHYL